MDQYVVVVTPRSINMEDNIPYSQAKRNAKLPHGLDYEKHMVMGQISRPTPMQKYLAHE